MKDLQGFYVLILQLLCKSHIMPEGNIQRKIVLEKYHSSGKARKAARLPVVI